ncbi:MAG: ECF transporter S component [Chloroflexota bacterium]
MNNFSLKSWTTRDILVVVVLAIVFALLTGPILALAFLIGSGNPLVSVAFAAVTTIPSLVAPYILRKPGAAFLTQFLMGLVQLPFSPMGAFIVVVGLINGVVGELPFLVTRYRNYSLGLLIASGVFSRLVALGFAMNTMGFANMPTGIQIGLVITAIVAGVLIAFIAKYLCDLLQRSGILSNYAISHDQLDGDFDESLSRG